MHIVIYILLYGSVLWLDSARRIWIWILFSHTWGMSAHAHYIHIGIIKGCVQ